MIAAALLLIAAHPRPSGADAPSSLSQREREEPARPAKGDGDRATTDQVARRYGLAGELLVARGNRILLDRGYGTIAPGGGVPHHAGERWRLASITKQVTAALIVKRFAAHLDVLDRPFDAEWTHPSSASFANFQGLTMRQLLTHHSGLANPDATPADKAGVPSFYRTKRPVGPIGDGFCGSVQARPGATFAYNNCDYLVAAELNGPTARWPTGMTMARDGDRGIPGFVRGKPEPKIELATYGAAGGLMGSARAVFAFDRSLMTGARLPPAALAELWKPEGNGSYQALGQWVFPGRLHGCAAPKRIVQRDGEIYGVQARNYILPDDDMVVIVFTNRSADDFAIGEVWEGRGFAYDLLSAAVDCEGKA